MKEEDKTEGSGKRHTVKTVDVKQKSKLSVLKAQNEIYLEKLQRLQADFENYQKRQQRERQTTILRANQRILTSLLTINDNLYRALSSGAKGGDLKSLKEGINMVSTQLKDILEKEGVRKIKSVGSSFDPTVHEALLVVESDNQPDNIVLEELEAGYTLHETTLRAAKVKVAKNKNRK